MSAVRGAPSGMRKCPLCSSVYSRLIRPLRFALFDDLGISGDSPLVSCRHCGMVFNDVRGGAAALARYYAGNAHYLAATTSGTGGTSAAEVSRYRRLLACASRHLEADTTIVDVGCGKGGLLSFLGIHGFRNLWGIEPSQASRDATRGNLSAQVIADVGALPEDLRPRFIVLSHVLEHLHDPLADLRTLSARSADDVLFYIECPNTRALPDPAWPAFFFEHINHFDMELMVALVRAAGLTVVESGLQSFLPDTGAPDECAYMLVAKDKGDTRVEPAGLSDLAEVLDASLPPTPLGHDEAAALLAAPERLALWGVSQYAMLVIGSHPELGARLVALYDASPAKQGRTISGIAIQPPSEIARLDDDHLLVLPHSAYTHGMLSQLPAMGFRGSCQLI